ncbi:homogentisate 1,2-dioxygenase [Aurantiacibacter xanthus]|uniref:Homogentisate 1,2-dioxygenase n=1 Tax=Aurantiacibacter xanthus TaxID=1784712 RepID=A0A3A1PC25_9SPHN|nr:homogentisate 1,2-dioxygenase [Aurantiacibacter xanthus]RIV90319.1 homogentisate 1,2-dioxygenase [Aurantiacibacter xanthus]
MAASAPLSCPAADVALGQSWSGWNATVPLISARNTAELTTSGFAPGQAIALSLHPDPEVAYASLPQGEGEETSFGGLARFTITEAGIYGVGAGSPLWIDVSRDGVPAVPVAYGRGVRCTPIRKVVSFELQPGDYVLEISGSETSQVQLMIGAGGVPQPD